MELGRAMAGEGQLGAVRLPWPLPLAWVLGCLPLDVPEDCSLNRRPRWFDKGDACIPLGKVLSDSFSPEPPLPVPGWKGQLSSCRFLLNINNSEWHIFYVLSRSYLIKLNVFCLIGSLRYILKTTLWGSLIPIHRWGNWHLEGWNGLHKVIRFSSCSGGQEIWIRSAFLQASALNYHTVLSPRNCPQRAG